MVETMISLPLIFTGFSSVIVILYLAMSHLLIEHWVYQAGLCLARQYPKAHCQKKLTREIDIFPFHQIQFLFLRRNHNSIGVKLSVVPPILKSTHWNLQIRLPLLEENL